MQVQALDSVEAPVMSFHGDDMGAAAIQNALSDAGWFGTVHPDPGEPTEAGTFSVGNLVASTESALGISSPTQYRYPNAKLRVLNLHTKDGSSFDDAAGQQAVHDAAGSQGTILAAFSDWLIQRGLGTVPGTTLNPLAAEASAASKVARTVNRGVTAVQHKEKQLEDFGSGMADEAKKTGSGLMWVGLGLALALVATRRGR